MKAVILAAGMGTRLGTLIPKPLTAIYMEKTIIDYQVERLSSKIGIDNINVVVGYKKEYIMEKHPNLVYTYNSGFAKTNTSKSLLQALIKLEDDVLFLNGDVYFEEDVLDLLIESPYSSFLVNTSSCIDEEIKYNVDSSNFIYELSKEVRQPLGEAVGINLIRKKDLNLIINELKVVADNDYFEKAFENLTMSHRLVLKPIDIGNYYVKEIDFHEDLVEVQRFINSSYNK